MQILVHWYVPLPDPVDLPPKHSWAEVAEAMPGLERVSVAGRQLDRPGIDLGRTEDLIEALHASMPFMQRPTESTLPDGTHPVTVAELVAVFESGCDPEESLISDAFDLALGLLQRLLLAYSLAANDPIRIPSRQSLPAFIPFVRREVEDEDEDQGWPEGFGLFYVNIGSVRELMRPQVTHDQLKGIGEILEKPETVFLDYATFRLDATTAFHRRGDLRSTILACATAAEVLFDDLLMHFLWETRTRPEDAAPIFLGRGAGLIARVRSEFHPRLGGDWLIEGGSPVAEWSRLIAEPRHRVIHAGYHPKEEDSKSALLALDALEHYLGDLLCKPSIAAIVPFTALALVGNSGFTRRGGIPKKAKVAIETWWGPEQSSTFGRWKSAISRLRAEDQGLVAPEPSTASVLLVSHSDGRFEWVAHDRATRKAALIEPRWDETDAERMKELLTKVLAAGPAEHTRASLLFQDLVGAEPVEDWVLEHRRVPLVGVMVDGTDEY